MLTEESFIVNDKVNTKTEIVSFISSYYVCTVDFTSLSSFFLHALDSQMRSSNAILSNMV
jgi:hypothetical protein